MLVRELEQTMEDKKAGRELTGSEETRGEEDDRSASVAYLPAAMMRTMRQKGVGCR